MFPRWILLIIVLMLLLAGGVAYFLIGSSPAENRKKPNIVLIITDALRKDHLGCYGYDRRTSPNIDRLAENGIKFTHCFSQAPWTTPSVGSLMASKYPSQLEIKDLGNRLKDEFILLPEVLQTQGYATGAVISHSFLNTRWNFNQGFDYFNEDNVFQRTGISSPGVTQRAIEFIDRNKDEPFFLFLHYFDTHYNFHLHEDFDFTGTSDYKGSITEGMDLHLLRYQSDSLTEADITRLKSFYDSEIAFTDQHIGYVLDHLKQLGLYDNAVIIFTADHGEEFLERGWLGHTKTLFNELTNVPLIIKYPGMLKGSITDEPAGLIDLYPTLMDYLDITPHAKLTGRSILKRTRSRGTSRFPVFSETSRLKDLRSIVQNKIKLILNLETSRYQMYDLSTDPREENDLVKTLNMKYKQAYVSLRDKLNQWMERVEKGQSGSENIEIPDDLKKHLNSIGY